MTQLNEFYAYMNTLNRTVKFTMVHSNNNIVFLDTKVSIQGDALVTELYQKPTDRNTPLHFSSAHSRPMVCSLPRSQLLRARRIAMDDQKWPMVAHKMSNNFTKRGYPISLISREIKSIEQLSLQEARRPGPQQKRNTKIPVYL